MKGLLRDLALHQRNAANADFNEICVQFNTHGYVTGSVGQHKLEEIPVSQDHVPQSATVDIAALRQVMKSCYAAAMQSTAGQAKLFRLSSRLGNIAMKLFPLLLGRTKVPYGQFYGGLSGWEGLGALFRFVTDKNHFIWVPIHAYLLEHPKEGLILFDAGICSDQAHRHRQYYRGILRLILDEDEYAQAPGETLPEQLKLLGYRCDDVRAVILTHLHEDHVGGLRDLSKAKIVISQAEWDARRMKMFGFIPMFYEPSYEAVEQWERVTFDSGVFHTFERSHDLFRDGSVRLLPTPGHTPGHTCALVDMGGYQLLVTGDCLYTLRHLATDQVQAFRLNTETGREQVDSIKRIAGLRKVLPGLHLLVGHDHTEYQWKHLVPYLSKGSLSESERRALSEYESGLFESDGTLRASAVPRFERDTDAGAVGRVTEPLSSARTLSNE